MKNFSTIIALVFACTLSAQTYRDVNAPIEERVEDALSRMTLHEKIAMIHAQSKFSSPGVARLGIPTVWCSDGPHGVRAEVLWDEWNTAGWTNDSCVAFPALTCLSATWNTEMSHLYGVAIGEEALYRGKTVLLGPGVNIYRTPLNGRNFEYMGEDPYLSSRMVVPYIQGVQEQGVAACVKHYALNDQEYERHKTNVNVSDRALYEIYLPAFKAAVQEAKSWSIMGSYNRYQNQYACHNETLLMKILRDEWGFDGAVISDWGGCCNTDEAIHNGLDLEYGSWTDGLAEGASNAYDVYYMARPYLEKIQKGEVGTAELDNKVRNVLRMIFRTTLSGRQGFGSLCSEEHYAAARQIAEEGMVLLQNKTNLLPLHEGQKILVVGENAIKPLTIGGGSSSLKVQREVSPLQGLIERAGEKNVTYVRGYVGSVKTEQDKMKTVDISDSRSAAELTAEAVAAAKNADVVIFVGGLNKDGHQDCEGVDRLQYELPYGQAELISALAAANKNLAVVLISGNAVAMPFAAQVPSILQAWFSGSEAGHALASVLFGDANPSGKMPFSIFPELADYPSHAMGERVYPGVDYQEYYDEGVFVGYRFADLSVKARKSVTGVANKMQPLFPFGHGLSYTTFAYGKATASATEMTEDGSITITLPITNTGAVDGKEVVELYIGDVKASVARPVKELKGFTKVALKAGETKNVSFTISRDALTFFDEAAHDWKAEPGQFVAYIGASSRDIRQTVKFNLK